MSILLFPHFEARYKMVRAQYNYGLSQRIILTGYGWKNNGRIVTKDGRDDFGHN